MPSSSRLAAPYDAPRDDKVGRVKHVLLGSDADQGVRASQNLLSLALICVFALVQQLEVLMGMIDAAQSHALSAFNVGTSLGSYLLIRSGLNLRLAPAEPSLTFAQTLCALTAIAWSYGITGAARGAVLGIPILVILFGGLFRLRARQTLMVALYALLSLAAVMVWRTRWATERYDAGVELIHFAFALIVLVGAAAVAIRLGRLRARLSEQKAALERALELNRQLATRDVLTGLLNRRAMTETLASLRPHGRRYEGAVTLALLDLDHFKRVNDLHGHAAGDAVLQRFAEVAREALRAGDLLARWGGEEFLLLMPGATADEAAAALERLRCSVAAGGFETLVQDLTVSFSAGYTEMAVGEAHDVAVARADQALYRAKNKGRDRCERG